MSLWMLYGLGVLYIAGPSLAIAAAGAATRTTVSIVTRAVTGLWGGGSPAPKAARVVHSTLSSVTILH
jgi:hypothetical protein